MGENAQKIGKKLETLGVDLLSLFNWEAKMRDKEIKCSRFNHKNGKGGQKRSHGIDLYMEYYDPYIEKIQGVFIECKNRQWNNITQSSIEDWVQEEINLIECARSDNELQEFYADGAEKNCGLLLINSNDDKFDKEKFREYLKNMKVPSKRSSYKIFIAGNDMIEKWDSITRMIKEDYSKDFKILYPSINNSQPIKKIYWSINQLYSKYIFGEKQETIVINNNGDTRVLHVLVIFFLDRICAESFQYMWSMCRSLQYEYTFDRFDVCFWVETKEETNYINENFHLIVQSFYKDDSSAKVLDKIYVKFLLNRGLNVVDNINGGKK